MIGDFLKRMEMKTRDIERRGNAKRQLVEQLNWIAAEMGKTSLEDRGRLEALKQLSQEMEEEFKVLDQDWPESWRGETRPPDVKERLRQLQEKREIRAKTDAARAEAIAARASRAVPTDPDPQSRDDAEPTNVVQPTVPGNPRGRIFRIQLARTGNAGGSCLSPPRQRRGGYETAQRTGIGPRRLAGLFGIQEPGERDL